MPFSISSKLKFEVFAFDWMPISYRNKILAVNPLQMLSIITIVRYMSIWMEQREFCSSKKKQSKTEKKTFCFKTSVITEKHVAEFHSNKNRISFILTIRAGSIDI